MAFNKKYYFTYNFNEDEIIGKIKKHEKQKFEALVFGELYVKTDNSKVIIQQKAKIQHALQRVFVGKILSQNNRTQIVGSFKYPRISLCLFVLFVSILLTANISLFFSHITVVRKLCISLTFLIAYLFAASMFLSGRF